MTKENKTIFENADEFIAHHLQCLSVIKVHAEIADEGQPQPLCTIEVEMAEVALTHVLTTCWNNAQIKMDSGEENGEENGKDKNNDEK